MEDNLVKVESLTQDSYETPAVFIPEDQSLYFGNSDFVVFLVLLNNVKKCLRHGLSILAK